MNIFEALKKSKELSKNQDEHGNPWNGYYGPWIENKKTNKRIRYTTGYNNHKWQLTSEELCSDEWEWLNWDYKRETGICDPIKFQAKNKRNQKRRQECIRNFTTKDWKECLKHFENKCAYCEYELENDKYTHQDHVIPVSKGGHTVRNNIVPSCEECNTTKFVKDYREFMAEEGYRITEKLTKWLNQSVGESMI